MFPIEEVPEQYTEEIFEKEIDEFRRLCVRKWNELYEEYGKPNPEIIKRIYWFLFEEPPFSPRARNELIIEFINNFGSHFPGREKEGGSYRRFEPYRQLQRDLDQIIEELQIPTEMLEPRKTSGEIFAKLYIAMRQKGYSRHQLIR